MGFADTNSCQAVLETCPVLDSKLEFIKDSADPDGALVSLEAIVNSGSVDFQSWSDADWNVLACLTGASTALATHLEQNTSHIGYVLAAENVPTASQMQKDLIRSVTGLDWDNALTELRLGYRRQVCAIAAVDLVRGNESVQILPGIAQALSDLADAVVASALVIAREHTKDQELVKLSVIAMGKCGARELNYVSDVDVMFVVEPAGSATEAQAISVGTELAKAIIQACSAATPQGTIWDVDAALRPEGKSGALVRTLASYLDYYDRWAQTWEYQALLKARSMAGDSELGNRFVAAVSPLIWQASSRPNFVGDVQAMRERVTDLLPAKEADRELKLGRGGLRDVEFAVQLLQMVHGRSDEMVRNPNTLLALEQLATWGYVGREDAAALDAAYRFLRTLEHRIQVHRMRRTHIMPTEEIAQRRLGRSMGFALDPIDELVKEWKKQAREVRRIHEKLFYRPLLQAVARLDSSDAKLSSEDAVSRLKALGYADPDGALRHLESLTSGVTRRAVIQRALLPVMLDWFASTPDPDAGLFGFRRVSEALGTTPWYLRLLRDESATAQRLAIILGSSRYATDLLLRSPDAVNLLADEESLQPRTASELMEEAQATAARYDNASDAVLALRAMRRRELFRVSAADVLGLIDIEAVGNSLTAITTATISGTVSALIAQTPNAPKFALIAMGRYGGGELSYGSDADVMFVYGDTKDPEQSAQLAHGIANELRTLLMTSSTDPELAIDADLRPEGKSGPLVRSLSSFAAYYQNWSSGWEVQALLRAKFIAGDAELGNQFTALIDPIRFKPDGLPELELREIRRLKARMESERLPRGVDPSLHTKLGPGGLSDVEWLVQILQLEHGYQNPEIAITETMSALRGEAKAELVSQADLVVLESAWKLVMRVRNATMLVRGRANDMVPTDLVELARVAHLLGYGVRGGQQLTDEYRKATRRARAVIKREFYGELETS
ncbi:MAG: bifunctional [glutamine synthetase] adenylyltransferase/[glutamine synthetase]-adenylyl-L-tyrosine phosphorylase [Actinobacteria bacterium]|nr:bifunctional [glutamine synthetase] adenylyltransferase/[glutamine synthetase]-adenylyl-L-tyrosine phosphorylase [Actinomycetota bacterium]MSW24830.1 bifunctional [glutamine synthetase] adenylyltransferase/[glutamine synthetase]-adenylyl-L-tyrosine phosphorylase [Actinomycetota bacterium]MSX29564.1 bifunctional [glutamine synthetase] adenylyltransferase/[glutamine synthetase]-adenylyl-L-tyrosine phosphorylase [Actinomycetota bacterium]MSX97895.1 bifunctional [glutamine synthetase] adenylyltra